MKLISIFMIALFTFNCFAQSGLEKFIYEYEYRNYIMNKSKNNKPFEASLECPKNLIEAQKYWKANKLFHGYMEEGYMEKPFTSEEILEMKNVNYHGVVGKVRGTDKILFGGYSLGSAPTFPHTRPGCEKYFTEEVKIVELDGKKCREISFKDPNSSLNYKQMFCENNGKIFINIDPNINKSKEDEECMAGKDLVHCNKSRSK